MELGHLPVMPDEVLGTLAPAPGSLQIDATVGGGGHTERILEAANPDGRVLGLDADQAAIDRVARAAGALRRPARAAPGELPRARQRRPRGRVRRRRRGAVRPRPLVVPARRPRPRASGSGPADRSTCASTPRAGVPGVRAARDARRRRAGRAVPALRRGAVGLEDRQGHRRRPLDRARRDGGGPGAGRRDASPRSTRASAVASTRRPACSRRCGSRSTRSSTRCPRASRPPSTCCGPAAAWSSCPTTRSRTASSSASSRPSGGAAPARPRCRSASAATRPACAW